MATNMAPHNLSEVVDGVLAYIDNTARASHSVVFIAYTCIDAYED